jgi:hypothetical protein
MIDVPLEATKMSATGSMSRYGKSIGAGLRSFFRFGNWRRADPIHGIAESAVNGSLPCNIILHHMRLFGLRGQQTCVLDRPCSAAVASARAACARGEVAVVLQPTPDFCRELGVSITAESGAAPRVLAWAAGGTAAPWHRLRTLHPVIGFGHPEGVPIVTDQESSGAPWLWLACERAGMLFIGTALADDLIRYRQGDPARGLMPNTEAVWGIPGERPLYLFEPQLDGEAPGERHADWWAMALIRTLAQYAGLSLDPILPGDAPGAIVLTGDDDQAYLEKYDEQLKEIGDLPITYFLHPQTRHDRASMARLFAHHRVDLGLHPDALEEPHRYAELFAEQAEWYRGLCGTPPLSVRNHGFLNQGYWGHLPAWLAGGVGISSNLPGLNGRVLNGSLLPARVVWQGELTLHWSMLTAIGDGVVSVLGMSPEASGRCILDLAENIRGSGVPGVIVLNLHPQNIAETVEMHRAVREVASAGFVAWTVRDCLEWFERAELATAAPCLDE